MAEPFSRTLADGVLQNMARVLYTVDDGRIARIKWISLFNDSGASVQSTILVRRYGTNRRIGRVVLDASGGHARIVDRDEDLVLSEGDAIIGNAATSNVIEFIISGTEEDAPGG